MTIVLESIHDYILDQPMTDSEHELVHNLRIMLKDLPEETLRSLNTLVEEDRGERWTNIQLLAYLQQALAEINNSPPMTNYDINNYPSAWRACIINGGIIYALIAEGILQNGKKIIFNLKEFCKLVSSLVIEMLQ